MDNNQKSGDRNSGDYNSGDWNSGNWNSGNRNSGNWNSGNWNSGNRNSGYQNSGDQNSGDQNSGNWNSGSYNSGDQNSGDRNSGSYNSGNWNSGYQNSGNRNSGNWNSGNWNSGDQNSGYLNSRNPTHLFIFNKPCEAKIWSECIIPNWLYFYLNLDYPKWVSFSDLSEDDKKKYPDSETLGGYLIGGIRKELSPEQKTELFKQTAQKSWNETTQEDKELTFKLPNFDEDVFFEIFGIDLKVKKCEIQVNDLSNINIDELLAEMQKILKTLDNLNQENELNYNVYLQLHELISGLIPN